MKKYSDEFREAALKLTDEVGIRNACIQLGIPYYTLSDWRKLRNRAAVKAAAVETENKTADAEQT